MIGPDMGKEPFGIYEGAEEFDENCEIWAKKPTSKEGITALLEKNFVIAPNAKTCGYLGIVISAGFLKMHVASGFHLSDYFLCRATPTYFGMMLSYYLFI
jgi:aromatic ring-opening dioxygenase LigB subunit